MTRLISIFLVIASSLLIFTGTTAASQHLTPQQEMWLQLELSFGPFKYVPHPAGPETDGFTDYVPGIMVHHKRETVDLQGSYILSMVAEPPEMDAAVFKSVNDQAYFGSPQDKPGPQRAPPGFPTHYPQR